MKYEDLSAEEINTHEVQLLERADIFWVETYGKEEATDIQKVGLMSRQGKLHDKFLSDLAVGFFKKNGLWRDGKTTLREREQQLILKKTKFGQKITQIKNSKIHDINEIIEKAEDKKKELEEIPVLLKNEYKIDKNKILTKLRADLDAFHKRAENNITNDITEVYNDFLNSVKAKQMNLIETAKAELLALQKHQKGKIETEVEFYSAELEAELQVLGSIENDERQIKEFEKEVRKINREINELRGMNPIEEIEEPIAMDIEDIAISEVFICPYCVETQKPFKNKGGLGSHIKAKHPDKFEEYKRG